MRSAFLQRHMTSIPNRDRDAFDSTFARCARGARSRHAIRYAIHGAGGGLALAAVATAIFARFGPPLTARWIVGLGAAGVALGLGFTLAQARRRTWTDTDLALLYDRRLGTNEAIVTAIEVPDAGSARRSALDALRGATPRDLTVAVFGRAHLAGLVAIVAFVLATRVSHPLAPVTPPAPGLGTVVLTQARGLELVERLATLSARDDAQRDRLLALARDARKLREDLAKGLEKRDAQDRAGRLAEAVQNERLTLGSGEERKGLETAIAALERDDTTKRSAAALGDHDLESMDRDLERQANAREADDRGRAKQALAEAEKAARAAGAAGVGKALADERARLEKREGRAKTLRDLADAIGSSDVKDKARTLDQAPSDANAKALANALADALAKLSKEERDRLASKLRELPKRGGNALAPEELERMAKEAESSEGQRELERRLREMANDDQTTPEAERDRALGDAEEGAGDTESELSGGAPKPGERDAAGQAPGAKRGSHGSASVPVPVGPGGHGTTGAGGGGSHHDKGRGNHSGATEPVPASAFKARARGPLNAAPLMPGTTTTWKPGEAGGTANVVGEGALGKIGTTEISGTDRSDVPQEYRDQVHKYFRP